MRRLKDEFNIKDLERLKYFLKMELTRSKEGQKIFPWLTHKNQDHRDKEIETTMDPNIKLNTTCEDEWQVDR